MKGPKKFRYTDVNYDKRYKKNKAETIPLSTFGKDKVSFLFAFVRKMIKIFIPNVMMIRYNVNKFGDQPKWEMLFWHQA